MRIAEKRAKLFKEWTLATMANDERYYLSTISMGIPDGNTREITLDELEDGSYDSYIDDMIDLYEHAHIQYGKAGYIIDGALAFEDDEQYMRLMSMLPELIYKR